MSSTALTYPSAPQNIDQKIIEPSPAFRQEVFKVLWSIVYFIVTYLTLVAGAVVLAILCGFAGLWLITAMPKIFTIMIGIGLVGLGVMVLFFLFKFVFSRTTIDRSHLVEITAKDQPVLFDFLRRVAKETQTPFPKRVYLSADVNACVFYNSGFWSMFLPVRKNLQIGLGLVNSINVSEFKAIIAHEFGHFSQRSMKLGSYVYNVNKVIYNMLYDNNSYGETLQGWANISGYFYFFASLTGGIVSGIQSVLKLQYTSINERYMSLSRQMEFHADSVAASVSGSKPLITSLRRLDVANNCYERVLQYYNEWYKENRKAVNIYQHHTEVMKHLAELHGLRIENGIVQVTADSFADLSKSRVIVQDQWASHPSTDDREKHLDQLNIAAEVVTESTWTLFTHAEALQQQVTDQLYQSVTFNDTPEQVDLPAFCSLYYAHVDKYKLDKRYKGFYNGRDITPFDVDATAQQPIAADDFDDVLTEAIANLPYRITGLETELRILEAIQQKSADIRTFEFNGKKYHSEEAADVAKIIVKELDDAKAALHTADQDIFRFHYKLAAREGAGQDVCMAYSKMFGITRLAESEMKRVNSILREVSQLYQESVTEGMVRAISNNMQREEIPVKQTISEILADESYGPYYTADEKKTFELFVGKHLEYFVYPRLDTQAVTLFVDVLNLYARVISDKSFAIKKQTLSAQWNWVPL